MVIEYHDWQNSPEIMNNCYLAKLKPKYIFLTRAAIRLKFLQTIAGSSYSVYTNLPSLTIFSATDTAGACHDPNTGAFQ